MKQFNSLKEIEFELKKLDLERQITREQIKRNYLFLQEEWSRGLFSSTMIRNLSKIGIIYLIKRLTK